LTGDGAECSISCPFRAFGKGITHDAVQGYTQMNKEHLLPAVCKALEAHESAKLKTVRNELHTLNHRLRAHMV